jgi:hypothetical protein
MLYSFCYPMSHKENFDLHLKTLTIKLKYTDFPGPLSHEMAKVALARQVLEDGPNRNPKESIAGISIGGFNKTIVDSTLPSHISVGSATDSTGARFYHFKGFQSNIYSAFIVSRLFDFYVTKFMKSERREWFMAKETSKAIHQNPDSFELNFRFYNKLNPIKIIEKSNRLYGPNHESVVQMYSK